MAITLKQFEELIVAKKPLPSLILLESDDAYVVDTVLAHVRRTLFGTTDVQAIARSCQEELFRADEQGRAAVEQLLISLKTVGMFASLKLCILKQAQELLAASEALLLETLQAGLSQETYLLMQTSGLRANSKLKKLFEAKGLVVKSGIERQPQFEAAILSMARSKNLRLDGQIVQLLMDVVPLDLSRVERELEKLSLYAGKNGTIDINAASELICSTNLESVFAMTDAIGEGRPADALTHLGNMLEHGESPQMLLTMLARHMRQLYRVGQASQLHVTREEVGAALETQSNFVIDKAMRQARHFSLPNLRQAMELIMTADKEMKSSSIAPPLILERLVRDLHKLKKENRQTLR